MAVKNLYGLAGKLAVAVNSAATILRVDSTLAGAISASGFVNGSDETYFALTTNSVYEVVKVTAVNGNDLTVVRGVGTTAQAFPVGADLNFVVTAAGIIAEIGPIVSTVQIVGSGLADVANPSGNNWTINVPAPNFTYAGGLSIQGTYPNLEFTYTPADCCGDTNEEAGAGLTDIEGGGIAGAYAADGVAHVNVPAPNFQGVGVTIEGEWPNITFTVTANGAGTVTSVGNGTGLGSSGSPTVNPTLYILNTGVVAGTYGGVEINARGQIVAVPATFNPISIAVAGSGVDIDRTADEITIGVLDAAIGVKGVVALVDHTDPYDDTITDQAVTPAALAVALATISGGSATGVNNYTAEADGDYTNVIAGSALAVELATGKKALVVAEVTMVDGTTPLTPVAFGMGIFNATPTRIKADRKITQSKQTLCFLIEGPVAASTWAIVTTAVPGGASVVSYSLSIQKLP